MDVGDEFGFVQAVESRGVTRILHCAGQGSLDEHGRILHVGDMAAQVREALNNVETVLRAAGLSLADVTRLNFYTTINAIGHPPIRRLKSTAGQIIGIQAWTVASLQLLRSDQGQR